MSLSRIPCIPILAAVLCSTLATAQYRSDFEALTTSMTGTPLAGQDGYYVPAVTGAVDFDAYPYIGNTLGVLPNTTGGNNFIAKTGPGAGSFGRAQRNFNWGSGKGRWTVAFDIYVAPFTGVLPATQNLGSVSTQPLPGGQTFIALATWTTPATALTWNADYIYYNAAGVQTQAVVPNTGFQGLSIAKWYRWETTIDLTTNEIIQAKITDIVAATSVTQGVSDWYLGAGTTPSPTPTGFRFFSGGSNIGNTLAFDNPRIDSVGYRSDFDGNTATAAGAVLPGQDGWYTPAVAGTIGFSSYTYAGNTLTVPPNPTGGTNFIAAVGAASPGLARTERPVDYACAKGEWSFGFDILAQFNGTLPATQNVGSVSLQPSATAKIFIALARWTNVATATTWNADYQHYDAAGLAVTEAVPDVNFQNLLLNKWYRWETIFNFSTNQIIEIRLTDVVASTTVKHNPVGWYLLGGSASTAPAPSAVRFFAGGSTAGNTLAYDNCTLLPELPAVTIYGCANPVGSLKVSGLPSIGTTVSFALDNPLNTQAAGSKTGLLLALAPDALYPCGTLYNGFGMAGGGAKGELLLYVPTISNYVIPGPTWSPGVPAVIKVPIPYNCNFIGFSVFFQGVILDLSSSAPAPIGLTQAAKLDFRQ